MRRSSPSTSRSTLVDALEQTCLALNVDRSTIIGFNENGTIDTSHSGPRPGVDELSVDVEPAAWRWLNGRLMNREVVTVSRLEDIPMEALAEREYARRSGMSSMLAVPVTIGERHVWALVVGSRQRGREWPALTQDRVRLLAGIICGALQRSRQDSALRASMAEIQQLNHRLTADNVCLKEEIKTVHDFDEIVGQSSVMREALERLAQVAPLNCAVLLLGETGTGKELFARAVHERSRRRSRALVRVNCAALPPSLIESELFGHEKGAFTGAVSLRQGRFELADGGTLFLDEIGDLPLDMQAKLLRVLQEGEYERVGSSRTRRADVRVIAATHHDLKTAVASGQFRADLYYRLNVFPITVPPLRERREDIPSLVWFFIHNHQRELGRHITRVPDTGDECARSARLAGQRARARKRHRARLDSIHRRHPAARCDVRRWPARHESRTPPGRSTRSSACTSRTRSGSATGVSTASATPPNDLACTRTRFGFA